jgi:hypothetical protein
MRYRVYATIGGKKLAKLIHLGLPDPSPGAQMFDSLEAADEYAFVQRLTGLEVTIEDTHKKPEPQDPEKMRVILTRIREKSNLFFNQANKTQH